MITINSIEDLIHFIETNELDLNSINDILSIAIGCVFLYEHPKKRLIEILTAFIIKWQGHKEKPLFIDSE